MNEPSTSRTVSTGQIIICDGYRCSKNAIESLDISLGILGAISLKLCKDCADKIRGIKV